MSGAEEYLDGLLHSVEGGSPADTARETEPGDTADGLSTLLLSSGQLCGELVLMFRETKYLQ